MMRMAEEKDMNRLNDLYGHCIRALDEQEIYQWNDQYPNRQTLVTNLARRSQFVFEDNGELLGAVCLNEEQALEWGAVDWSDNDKKCLIVHALVVSPKHQGNGYGQKFLEIYEAYAVSKGYKGIRLDAFSENPIANRFYKKNNYVKVGQVVFDYKPEGHQVYYCYEKMLID